MFSKFKPLTTINADSEAVQAFKYNVHSFESGTGESIRRHKDITEIFIPSHNICFNEMEAFKSEKPRAYEDENTTEIYLSQDLVNKVVQCASLKAQLDEVQFSLIINQEYQNIISEQSRSSRSFK